MGKEIPLGETNGEQSTAKIAAVLSRDEITSSPLLWAAQMQLTPGRFSLLLALVIAALFPQILFGSETWFYRDFGGFGYPLAQYHRDCFWNGEWPVWNSLSACGIPYLAQWNTMTLYPLSLIYLLAPLPWSLGFFCLSHLFLAGLGMYLLAFFWTKDPFAAAVAGAAYAFNGLTLHCLMWPNNIAGLGWMPWVVLTVQRGWQNGGRALIIGGLTGAVQMLSGAPEVILFTWLALFVLFSLHLFSAKTSRSAVVWRSALIVTLVVGLAAAQLLPFLDLLGHSDRDANFGVESWAMPLWGWINLVLPLFRSSQAPTGVFFQIDQWWTSSYYPGVCVVVLALLSLRLARGKRVWALWSIAAFGLIMALGEKGYLYSWMHTALPMLGFIRFPIKFVVLPIFVFPILAAHAVAALRTSETSEQENDRSTERWISITAGATAACVSGAILFSYWHPYHRLNWSALLQNGILRIVFIVLVVAILARLQRSHRLRFWLQTAIVLCLVLDVWTHMPNQNPTVNSSLYEPGLIARQLDPKCANGEARALLPKSTHDFLYHRMLTNHTQDFLGRRAGLFGNCNLLDRTPIVDGFYSLYLLEQRQIWSRLFHAPATNFPSGLADFVGIRQVSTNLFEWELRPSAQPLVTAGARPVFADGKDVLKGLTDAAFDPREIVYLPTAAKASVVVTNRSTARISNSAYRAGRIAADVDASEPTLLIAAETYYDGWHAVVNNKPAKIWRANHAFQAVEIPAGHSHVELIYKEKYLSSGIFISSSTLLGCVIGWFRQRKKRQKADPVNQIDQAERVYDSAA